MRVPYLLLQAVLVSERSYIKRRFRHELGYLPNLEHPQTFNEKIQYLKLYHHPAIQPSLVDKLEVRAYITEKGCAWTLNDLLRVYQRPEQIDLGALPDRFVLKMTNGSGWNILCRDKASLDWRKEYQKLLDWFRISYYYYGREWVYRSIRPRVVAERYLGDPGGPSLMDYKFYCVEGEPFVINVDLNRDTRHVRNLYDLEWKLLPYGYGFPTSPQEVARPSNLDEMLQVARTLAHGHFFCRVDLYSLAGRTLFGELTFIPGNGFSWFEPQEYDAAWGARLDLGNLAKYV